MYFGRPCEHSCFRNDNDLIPKTMPCSFLKPSTLVRGVICIILNMDINMYAYIHTYVCMYVCITCGEITHSPS